ncbi:hypothetical protein PVAP13_6KG013176 [Panicum virgatum]|uniref:Uncharacterized protein n=1 Tax=Panicum virgatum TaxID=38727 RepID=A0A8T0R633_PANVG|nr:hypothetical protein PVAP13_6KG013176 [Panicum virgatum]
MCCTSSLALKHKQKQLSRGKEWERKRYRCPCDAAQGRGAGRKVEVGTSEKNQELLGARVEGVRPDLLEKRKKMQIDWRRRGWSHGIGGEAVDRAARHHRGFQARCVETKGEDPCVPMGASGLRGQKRKICVPL